MSHLTPGTLYKLQRPNDRPKAGNLLSRVPADAPSDPLRPIARFRCGKEDNCTVDCLDVRMRVHPSCAGKVPVGYSCPDCGSVMRFECWLAVLELAPLDVRL